MNKRILGLVVPFLSFALVGCQKTANSQKSNQVNTVGVSQNETATIKWDWDNGETVVTKTCEIGEVPTYDYATDGLPKKTYPDKESCYVFNGWSPEVKVARKAITYTYTALYVVRPDIERKITFDCAECMVNGRYHSEETHTASDLPLTYRFVLPASKFVRALPASHCVQIKDDEDNVVTDGYTYDETTGELTITKLESNITVSAVSDYACASLIYQYNERDYTDPVVIKPGPGAVITYVDWGDGSFPDKGNDGTFTHSYSKASPDFNGCYTIRIYQDRNLTSFILCDATSYASGKPLSLGNLYISSIDFYYVEGVPIQIADYAFAYVETLSTMNLSRIPYIVELGVRAIYGTLLDGANWSGASYCGVIVPSELCMAYTENSTWLADQFATAICPPIDIFGQMVEITCEMTTSSTYLDIYFTPGTSNYMSELRNIFRVFVKPEYSSFYRLPPNLKVSFLQNDSTTYVGELSETYLTHKCKILNSVYASEMMYHYYMEAGQEFIKYIVTADVAKIDYKANGGKINGLDTYSTFVNINETPKHPTDSDVTLTHPSDDQYDYTFAGWNKEPEPATGNQTYIAMWNAVPKAKFNISWYDYDKITKLGTTEVPQSSLPSGEEYKDITYKMHDNTNHYSFDSWKEIGTDNPLSVASKDTSYYASFKVSNTLSIKFNGTNVVEDTSKQPSFTDSCTYRAGSKVIYKFSAINGATLPEQILVKYAHANEGAPSYIWNSAKGTLEIDESLLNDDISILINA